MHVIALHLRVIACICYTITYRKKKHAVSCAFSFLTGILSVVCAVIWRVSWIDRYYQSYGRNLYGRNLIKSAPIAHVFNQKTSFGIGLILANPIFMILLGFSAYQYQDGSKAITENDIISTAAYKLDNWIRSARKGDGKDAISLLKELGELHADGVIDDETYEKKKADLLKRI